MMIYKVSCRFPGGNMCWSIQFFVPQLIPIMCARVCIRLLVVFASHQFLIEEHPLCIQKDQFFFPGSIMTLAHIDYRYDSDESNILVVEIQSYVNLMNDLLLAARTLR